MSITFHPNPGTVLICDFSTGFQPPEMVKRRHVVVVSPRRRHHSGLCLVVPFSTVAPNPVEAFHHLIPVGAYPFFHPQRDVWAKGDMGVRPAGSCSPERPVRRAKLAAG